MAFNDQEQQIIQYGVQNGKSKAEIMDAVTRLRTGVGPKAPDTQPAAPNSTIKDLAIGAGKGLMQTISAAGAQHAGPVGADMTAHAPEWAGYMKAGDDAMHATNSTQQVGKVLEIAGEVATPFVVERLARIAPEIIKKGSEIVSNIAAKGKDSVGLAQDAIKPKNTPVQAVAQIAQGKTDALPSVAHTLSKIDTKGVKTYSDLLAKVDENIPAVARQVDAELSKDTTQYTLDQLASIKNTKGGQPITTDYVSRALSDLRDLYKAIGDDVKAANISEIASHAATNGLTRKEVNDISRVYGQEFGSKAFTKLGDPLTGTNAQAFETTRTGLKDVARQGLGGPEAKALDSTLSAMYDTKALVQKNVEAVAKLQQRIQERGLVEKAGYLVSKYADILSGGTLRGFVGGILPRGAGYKTMNAIDIEAALRGNLDVIEKALAQGSDEELIAVLKKTNPTFKTGGQAGASQ